ncbi:hypothetical protein ACFQ0T_02790 [Kitasatospora gansuensis]
MDSRDGLHALLVALAADFVEMGVWDVARCAGDLGVLAGGSTRVPGSPFELEPVTWGSVAEQLLAARVYE